MSAQPSAFDAVTPSLPRHGPLGLPSELFRIIWAHLGDPMQQQPVAKANQHALMAACKATRAAAIPLIHALSMRIEEDDGSPQEQSMQALRRFPSAATLTTLRYDFRSNQGLYCLRPGLLPMFFLQGRDRLANLEVLELSGHEVICAGAMSSLAQSCPRLRELRLMGAALTGFVFAPLAHLASLRAVHLHNIYLPFGAGDVSALGPSLAPLTAITRLEVTDDGTADPAQIPSGQDFSSSDLLPHLGGLRSLVDLNLSLFLRESDFPAAFDHLTTIGSLSHLTSLRFHPNAVLFAVHVAHLTGASQLVSLNLSGHTLDAPSIRLLAAMPQLRRLEAWQLNPDENLSKLPCGWTDLTLDECVSPQQLNRLPVSSVERLRVYGRMHWTFGAARGVDANADAARRACATLARVWYGDDDQWHRILRLEWDQAPPAGAPSSAAVLAALEPLEAIQPFQFDLGSNWGLGGDHAQALLAALPSLESLVVLDATDAGFPHFVAAIAASAHGLSCLLVGGNGSVRLPALARDALLAAAAVRVARGPPLIINGMGAMTEEEADQCNATVTAIRGAVGKSERNWVRFVCWEMYRRG